MADLEEDFLECGDADAVGADPKALKILVKIGEECAEVSRTLLGQLVGDLARDFLQLLGVLDSLLDELVDLWSLVSRALRHDKIVADAVSILEEEGRASALDFALRHDRYSVAEDVSLLHVVGC